MSLECVLSNVVVSWRGVAVVVGWVVDVLVASDNASVTVVFCSGALVVSCMVASLGVGVIQCVLCSDLLALRLGLGDPVGFGDSRLEELTLTTCAVVVLAATREVISVLVEYVVVVGFSFIICVDVALVLENNDERKAKSVCDWLGILGVFRMAYAGVTGETVELSSFIEGELMRDSLHWPNENDISSSAV